MPFQYRICDDPDVQDPPLVDPDQTTVGEVRLGRQDGVPDVRQLGGYFAPYSTPGRTRTICAWSAKLCSSSTELPRQS